MGGLGWRCAGVGERWIRPRGRAGWRCVSRDGRGEVDVHRDGQVNGHIWEGMDEGVCEEMERRMSAGMDEGGQSHEEGMGGRA